MFKIAIGVGENKNILEARKLFLQKNYNCTVDLIYNESTLIKSISNYDAVIRGSLPSNKIMKEIKTIYSSQHIQRATFVNGEDKLFLLGPVGIDEGNNLIEKYELTIRCSEFLLNLNIQPKIAILANGRKGDYGRSQQINNSIDESEKLVEMIKDETNFEVKNYYILIEKAIEDKANIIIASDGIVGNILFRTLVLINKLPSNGAIAFGMDKIFIDTSRDQTTEVYLKSMELAYNLICNL